MPKRKAADPPDDSPSKRPALGDELPTHHTRSATKATPEPPLVTPKVRRTYGKRTAKPIPVEPEETKSVLTRSRQDKTANNTLQSDITLTSPSPTKSRTRKLQGGLQQTPGTRKSTRNANAEPPLPIRRTPRSKPVVEITIPKRLQRTIDATPICQDLPTPPSPSQSNQEPPAIIPTTPQKQKTSQHLATPPSKPERSSTLRTSKVLPQEFYPCLNAQRKAILAALQDPSKMFDMSNADAESSAMKQLEGLLHGTVSRSEGNSCLLLGPRGSGKSTILDKSLKSLSQIPIIIRLSGWIHHTDRLAMREIAYQLGQQTGQSFLENDDNDDNENDFIVQDDNENPFMDHTQTTDAEPIVETSLVLPPPSHLPALISVIPTLSRPTIVILDAFDLFALHPRQALLYCLLDTVQSCRTGMDNKGIAVIGMTTRIDTINLLEKRVKSRFSGRVIRAEGVPLMDQWLSLTRKILTPKLTMTGVVIKEWEETWERRISDLMDNEEFIEKIKDTVGISKDPTLLSRILTYSVSRLTPASPYITNSSISQAISSQRSRAHINDSFDFPYPSICLLVSCMYSITAGHDIFTFEMLYSTFRNQLRASMAAPVQVNGGSIGMVRCSKAILFSAFEHLIASRVFVPTSASSNAMAKEFTRYRSTLERDDVRRIVDKTGQVSLKKWLSKAV